MKNDEFFPIKTATACASKWNWSTLYLNKGDTRSCHRASISKLTPENFDNFHNTDEKIEARKKMLQGKWPGSDNDRYSEESCGYCKKIEDFGGFSDRQHFLTIPNLNPPELKNNSTAVHVSPTVLEIFFNNTCNLACNYCGGNVSSKIDAEENKWGYFKKEDVEIIPQKPNNYYNLIPHFWKWFEKNYFTLRRLHILGGEPFYQPEILQLIDFFEKNPAPNLELSCFSNLAMPIERLQTHIEKIKKLMRDKKLLRFDFTCSIDCWGPQQEYVRLGLDLKNWEENFNYILSQKWIYLVTQSVVGPLTIKTMPELFEKINEWRKIHKIRQHVGGILGPDWWKTEMFGSGFFTEDFNKILLLMPEDTDEQITIKKYMKGIVNVVESSSRNERYIRNFMIWLKEKDRRRNTDYKKVFPWLEEFDLE